MRVVSALYRRFDSLIHELAKFGTVGGIAYVVQLATTNALWWVFDMPPLAGQALGVLCATVVAFLGNRFWTFRHRARSGLLREYALFFFFNGVGLGIQVGCQAFSLYVLGLDGPLAQNISGNIIGVGLGTLFRFWSYKKWVFRAPEADDPTPEAKDPARGVVYLLRVRVFRARQRPDIGLPSADAPVAQVMRPKTVRSKAGHAARRFPCAQQPRG